MNDETRDGPKKAATTVVTEASTAKREADKAQSAVSRLAEIAPNLRDTTVASLLGLNRDSLLPRDPGVRGAIDAYVRELTATPEHPARVGLTRGLLGLNTSDLDVLRRQRELDQEIAGLRQQIDDKVRALSERNEGAKRKVEELEKTIGEYKTKDQLGFLLNRVHEDARKLLLDSTDFQKRFLETRECNAVVMSVDIRRSTDLMLKARTPEEFANFITKLCEELNRIVLNSWGVFDKFTGDGILAFFPDFFSGDDAAFYALSAADKCHQAFKAHYHRCRKSFTSILTDIGLGIGIDYGRVHLVQVAGGLTVVGEPVVYACRLSGAPPGVTLANQPAYEILSDRCGGSCFTAERDLEIKHEGRMLAYEVKLNSRQFDPARPGWQGADATDRT